MQGQVEKNSPSLGRMALYEQKQRINRLPSYLTVNFVRFFYKAGSEVSGTKAGKAKILKNVAFPLNLDMYDFCSDELKTSLDQGRLFKEKAQEEADAKRHGTLKKEDEVKKDGKEDVEMKEEAPLEMYDHTGKRLVGAAAKAELKKRAIAKHDKILYRPHNQGLDTGEYELIAVVTHKGRSADGGHYLGWVHATGDDWIQCDDEYCTVVKT